MTVPSELFHVFVRAVAVLSAQIALYILIPVLSLRLRFGHLRDILTGMIIASTLIAGIGLVLGWTVTHPQRWAVPHYLVLWAVIAVIHRFTQKPRKSISSIDPVLIYLVAIAVLIRWIHPLTTWALGQSDAYTHLTFARELVEGGRLSNPIYPPGYAWIMALPTLVFGIDPYWVARFGGAFWGAALTMALYSIVQSTAGRVGARIAAGVAAGSPLAWWLVKTGVGAFPNQIGLFLLPIIVQSLIRAWRGAADRTDWNAFFFAMTLLAISVPMMFLQVVLLMVFLGLWMLLAGRRTFVATLIAITLTLPGAALFGLHVARAGGAARSQTPAHLTGGEVSGVIDREDAPSDLDLKRSQIAQLAADYLRLKRWNSEQWPLMITMGIVSIGFLGIFFAGWRFANPAWIAIGAWGVLTSVQTGTGSLQFSNYQREGWSLMLATIVAGGLLAEFLQVRSSSLVGRILRTPILAISLAAVGVFFPPAHHVFGSPAENELIAFLRALQGDTVARKKWPELETFWRKVDGHSAIRVISRPISGFSNRVGDPVYAFSTRRIRSSHEIVRPEVDQLSIVLLDAEEQGPSTIPWLMKWLQPSLTQSFVAQRLGAKERSARLEARAREQGLPTRELILSPRLRAVVITGPAPRT